MVEVGGEVPGEPLAAPEELDGLGPGNITLSQFEHEFGEKG